MKRITSEQIRAFVSGPQFEPEVVMRKDPNWPRISVVVPSYNQASFIEQTLLSIVNQNYPNTELIVVDGGSSDGTLEIIGRYQRYIAHWISEPDGGQLDAIYKGMRIASGELVAYQNSDDLYLPGSFRTVSGAFKEGGDLIYGNTLIVDGDNNILREFRNVPASLTCLFYSASHIPSQAAFLSRALSERIVVDLADLARERIQFGMERLIFGLALVYARNPLFLRQTLGCFRVHERSKTFCEAGMRLNKASEVAGEDNRFIVAEFIRRGYVRPFSWRRAVCCWARRLVYLLVQLDFSQMRTLLRKALLVPHVRRHYE